MKKSLFLIASLVMTNAAFAQWTKPVPKFTDEFRTSTLAGDNKGDSIFYYLYNVDGEGFLTHGNAPAHSQWASNAVLGDKGNKMMVAKYILKETAKEGTQNVDPALNDTIEWDGKTYVFEDVYSDGKWHGIIITSAMGCFMDRASQIDYKWEINKVNGAYRINTADVNPNFNNAGLGFTESYFGWDDLDSDWLNQEIKSITPAIDVNDPDKNGHIDWQFVNEEDYDAYLKNLDTYLLAMNLADRIEVAKEEGINTTAAEAVYANTAASYDQIKEALDALNEEIINKEFGGASEENPYDATGWIVNADFAEGNANGWTNTFVKGTNATNVGYQGASYNNGDVTISQFIEAWANTAFNPNFATRALGQGELSQTITNMPQGKYKFTVDCIANNQDGKETTGVQLFATGGDIDIFQNCATGNGAPQHFEITFVNNGSEIKMGLRTSDNCTANWIAADNFTLTYYGPTTEDPYKLVLDGVLEDVTAAHPMDEFDEVIANATVKANFKAAVEAAEKATDNYTEIKETLEAANAALNASIEAYASYLKSVETVEDYLNNNSAIEGEMMGILSDYINDEFEAGEYEEFPNGSKSYILENLLLNDEQIKAEGVALEVYWQEAVKTGMKEGDDVTHMLKNPSFANGFTGWVNKAGVTGGLKEFPIVECYQDHGKLDCSQTITDVPDGIYAVSVQAFERTALPANLDPTQPSVCSIYLNNFSSPVMNICDDAMPEDQAIDKVNCLVGDGGGAWPNDNLIDGYGWIPNSVDGGSYAFMGKSAKYTDADGNPLPRYTNTAYGLVTDGTMKIGLTSNGQQQHWALWANFKLTYMGKNVTALNSVLETLAGDLETMAEENGMNSAAKAAAAVAIANANKYIGSKDKEELWVAVQAINEAITNAKKDVAIYADYENAKIALEEAYNTYNSVCNESVNNKYYDLSDKTEASANYSYDEFVAYVEEIKDCTAAFKVPNIVDTPTLEEPADLTQVIENATFDEIGDFTGWLGSSFGAGGTTSTCAERYSMNYDTYQNLAGLPAGTYQFSCYGFYRQGAAENDYKNTVAEGGVPAFNAYIYVIVGEDTIKAPIVNISSAALETALAGSTVELSDHTFVPNSMESANNWFEAGYYAPQGKFNNVVFTVPANGKVRIGVMKDKLIDTDWSIFDNFKLLYYGADVDVNAVAIDETVNSNANVSAIYTISGVRANSLAKGINIVKMSDGSVKKVIKK